MRRFIPQTAIAVAALATLSAESQGAVLYDSTVQSGAQASVLVRPHIPASAGDLTAVGDDYGTSYSSITVTGLSFLGTVGASSNLFASFYNSSKQLVGTVTPSSAQLSTSTASYNGGTTTTTTIASSAFGTNGLTLGGTGYVVIGVTSSDGTTRPSVTLGFTNAAPTVGSNDSANAAELDYQGTFSTGPYVNASVFSGGSFTSVPADVAEIQLTGVPEPTSLALLATPLAMVLRRRRA